MLARYQGLHHACFFHAWCDVFKNSNHHAGDADFSDDYSEEEEEEEEEESDGEGNAWSVTVRVLWYLIVFGVVSIGVLIGLPHLYLAMPHCASSSALIQKVSVQKCKHMHAYMHTYVRVCVCVCVCVCVYVFVCTYILVCNIFTLALGDKYVYICIYSPPQP